MKKLAQLLVLALSTTLVALAAAPTAQVQSAKQAKLAAQAAEKRLKDADLWVTRTLAKMTLDEKIGQLIFTSFNAAYMSTDGDEFERLRHLVRDLKVGGIHVFGSAEALPQVMLNPVWGGGPASRKGDPYAAATTLNRLQSESAIPLLTSGDFEGGAAYILNGATRLPRAMVIGATGDEQMAFKAGVVAATEARAVGVNIDFYPVVDVNNNARNPIINLRSFGEDPAFVSKMAVAYIKGIQSTGALATAKHFPGHGDTNVDTHLGLAVITHPRERLDQVELVPFKAAIAAGVDAVMSSHIVLPSLDPTPGIPATLSRPILTGLLRNELKFNGLIFTDSMTMDAISKMFSHDKAAAMAVNAGVDFVLHSPDDDAAFRGIKAAVAAGEISESQINASVERILRSKARLGLHLNRQVDVAAIADRFGTRAHAQIAQEINDRGLTLIKDERTQVPLAASREANVLYLSVLDYASGWREGIPSRTIVPELKKRWPNLTSVEVTDRTTASEYELIRALTRRADAVVAGVFVRIASFSGRMDLSQPQIALLDSVAAQNKPFVTVCFGNPYTATFLPKLPAVLLGYEFSDFTERAAAKALAGEIPIGGRLPISLPGMFPAGHGLTRAAK
ncbi:MAG: glycoside hydrolase family 3 protein [Vicinamibacterales bacterium]|jgi:beta-N-acetylhexosaminidase|nr:glycoside hydrolase family 3 protein [Vicinamibacterales bacterium]